MSDEFPNEPIAKTYVRHKDKWFFISTIERTSSAAINNPPRYWETIVWAYDYAKAERGEMLFQGESSIGSIGLHFVVARELFDSGEILQEEE